MSYNDFDARDKVAVTGSNTDGTNSGANCNNWRSNAAGVAATVGETGHTDSAWLNKTTSDCSQLRHLYCVSQ